MSNNIKKIAHITATYPPYEGGTGRAVYYLHKELASIGVENDVFTVFWKNTLPPHPPLTKGGTKGGVFFLKPWFTYGNAAFVPQLLWKLRSYDVLHVQYAFFGGLEFILLAKWLGLLRAKIILQYQNDVIGKGIVRPIAWLDEKLFFKPLLRAVDKVFILSRHHYEHSRLKKYESLIQDKLVEFPNGFDSEQFTPREKNRVLMEKVGILQNQDHGFRVAPGMTAGDEPVVVGFTGALDDAHYFKGVEDLIDAFAIICRDVSCRDTPWRVPTHLLIIGGGNLQKEFERRAAETLPKETYTFTGSIPNEQMPDYLTLCDIFVLPSYEVESFGIVVAEALALEKPVIVSDLPALQKLWGDPAYARVFKQRDIHDLAKKIQELIFSHSESFGKLRMTKLHRMGAAGRKAVLEKYTWKSLAQRLKMIYVQKK